MQHIVNDQVASSVGLYVTVVSPPTAAQPIEMPFRLRTWVGPRNHMLDGAQIPPWEGAILSKEGHPTVKYRDTLHKNGLTNRVAISVENSGGPKEPRIRWGFRSPWDGAIILAKGAACC